MVGGAVRDELLGRPSPNDLDVVIGPEVGTNTLSSDELAALLADKGLLDQPPTIYPQFGTALFIVRGTKVEVVAARKESYRGTSRKPTVEPASLLEDAQRRDFTVNAILKGLHGQGIRDPLGTAFADLESRLLRTPLNPDVTFSEDPLRMLRAVRFRWQLDLTPVPELWAAIAKEAPRLAIISAERIREELEKILLLPDADNAFDDLMTLGLLDVFAPEFRPMLSVGKGGYHHLDAWHHSLLVVRNAGSGDLVLSLGALFHDIGKPPSASIDPNGAVRFLGHEGVGAEMTEDILTRLRFPSDVIRRVVRLVRNHMRLSSAPTFSASAARRLVRDLDEDIPRLLSLVEADAASLKPGIRVLDLAPIRNQIAAVESLTPASTLDSPLSGDTIMEVLHLAPGPDVGDAKKWLLEQVLEGRLAPDDDETAVQLLRDEYFPSIITSIQHRLDLRHGS